MIRYDVYYHIVKIVNYLYLLTLSTDALRTYTCVTFIQLPIMLRHEDYYAYDMFVDYLYFVTAVMLYGLDDNITSIECDASLFVCSRCGEML